MILLNCTMKSIINRKSKKVDTGLLEKNHYSSYNDFV